MHGKIDPGLRKTKNTHFWRKGHSGNRDSFSSTDALENERVSFVPISDIQVCQKFNTGNNCNSFNNPFNWFGEIDDM